MPLAKADRNGAPDLHRIHSLNSKTILALPKHMAILICENRFVKLPYTGFSGARSYSVLKCCGAAVGKGKKVRGGSQNFKCQITDNGHESQCQSLKLGIPGKLEKRTLSERECGQQDS